ncbi:hypothetical protein BHM03_00003231 [Ensete ventricosum]|nr:hypothetical protein BHM03_00003231 [Ensete ventricosum]
MAKYRGESSKMGQVGPLPQAAVGALQVQTCLQTAEAAHEGRGNEQDKREVGYSPRTKEAQSGAPTGKRDHKERLSTVETHLDVLEASFEEFYQGQGRLIRVENSQEDTESRIDRVESLIDQLTKDTKDFVRHLHGVVAKLTTKKQQNSLEHHPPSWLPREASSCIYGTPRSFSPTVGILPHTCDAAPRDPQVPQADLSARTRSPINLIKDPLLVGTTCDLQELHIDLGARMRSLASLVKDPLVAGVTRCNIRKQQSTNMTSEATRRVVTSH